jgi:hypothetical protein
MPSSKQSVIREVPEKSARQGVRGHFRRKDSISDKAHLADTSDGRFGAGMTNGDRGMRQGIRCRLCLGARRVNGPESDAGPEVGIHFLPVATLADEAHRALHTAALANGPGDSSNRSEFAGSRLRRSKVPLTPNPHLPFGLHTKGRSQAHRCAARNPFSP